MIGSSIYCSPECQAAMTSVLVRPRPNVEAPPTARAINDMISAMRHLLGPEQTYKIRNEGEMIVIPEGLTLFHGTLARFDYRTLKVWSWFATHMNSPVSMIGEHW
jgi:hypothetical protein